METQIIRINKFNTKLVQFFINELQTNEASRSFRYFSSRTIDVLKHHVITIIMQKSDNNEIIGYAHLDKDEKGDVWFGICVLDKFQGKGYGKKMMEYIIYNAKDEKLEKIKLSVDKTNSKAYVMYKKYGFEEFQEKNQENIIYMEKNIT
jgi:ribosomal protein S18 acetylase RimI-like enzyme